MRVYVCEYCTRSGGSRCRRTTPPHARSCARQKCQITLVTLYYTVCIRTLLIISFIIYILCTISHSARHNDNNNNNYHVRWYETRTTSIEVGILYTLYYSTFYCTSYVLSSRIEFRSISMQTNIILSPSGLQLKCIAPISFVFPSIVACYGEYK